jgi:serine/threonine protein kinase
MTTMTDTTNRWRLEEGDEIVPGRQALRRLGGGDRYEAYLAFDERLHAIVVAKVVRPHLIGDEHTLDGLRAETEMLARLDHPVIVRAFEAVLDGDRPHLVLEHLEGPRLSTLIRRYGPLPPEQLVPLGVQLCSALHYMASEGVVHLDVKPANVIMSGPPRLIDLSVARPTEDAADLDRPIGTDAYMAPEQCDPRSLGPVTPAADMWGLGATLYRAAVDEPAYPEADRASTEPSARWPQLHDTPVPIHGRVPEVLADTITACLAADPSDRPAPAPVADTLERLLEAQPRPKLAALKPRWR